ncbi:hypothetical protein PANDA_016824, partial [Ailuropoda melanoleuca]
LEAGEKMSRIGKVWGLSASAVATIRDKIGASSQAAPRLTRSRSLVIENMEWLLSVWTEDQNQRNVPVSVTLLQEKARSLLEALKWEQGEGAQSATFG